MKLPILGWRILSPLPILGNPTYKKNICYIFFTIAIAFFLYIVVYEYEETFANKNSRTILDVHGEILGFELTSHTGTFDSEPEFEPYIPDQTDNNVSTV